MSNPFQAKLEKAQAQLAKLEAQYARFIRNAMPGTYVTGNSGVPAARRAKLDRQLDRTIDLSRELVELRARVAWLARSAELYDQGAINAQGRSISHSKAKNARGRTARNALMAEIHKVCFDMDAYGYGDFRGRRLSLWIDPVFEDKKADPIGIVKVVAPDGTVTNHQADSIQGVDFEKKSIEVMQGIALQKQ